MHPLVTPESWAKSVGLLAIEITLLSADQNLMPDKSAEKGFFFFSDSGIPLPRPITAVAWASLLNYDPIWGFVGKEWAMYDHRFILPFLPPGLKDDPADITLSRQSNLHTKNEQGQIDWGLAMFYDLTLFGMNRADINIRYFNKFMYRVNDVPYAYPVPPLWADFNEGFQFGYVQPNHSLTMREPFERLAAHGIPLVNRLSHKQWPIDPIRRLMFRFFSTAAGYSFAQAYLNATRNVTGEAYEQDMARFRKQLHDLYESRKPKKTKRDLAVEAMVNAGLGEFMLP